MIAPFSFLPLGYLRGHVLILDSIFTWAMPYPNLCVSTRSQVHVVVMDQADQRGLIHDDIGEGGYMAVICQCFSMNFRFANPAQPGVIQLTIDLDLIEILRT